MRLIPLFVINFVLLGAASLCAGERVLFAFDDHSIPWRHNLKLTLEPATKHPGNPVLRRGPAGAPDHGHAILYGSVIKIGGKFRMWYLGMTESAIEKGYVTGHWRPMCYAESDDGVHWIKPELGLVELNGSRRNNICLIEAEVPSLANVDDFLSVLHDPDDPDPARRYKVAYIAHVPQREIRGLALQSDPGQKRWCSFECATSPDGLRWKVVGDRPRNVVNAGGETFEVSGLYRFDGVYYATGQSFLPAKVRADGVAERHFRIMRVFRSADFVRWEESTALGFARPGQLASPPVAGQQTHMGAGMWNRGNVVVGLYGMWQDAPSPPPKGEPPLRGVRIDLGLVLSNDGIHFREPVADFKVLACGPAGAWDDVALLQGQAFLNEGERTMIWYSHWDTGGKLKSMEIGLATLRRDGFGYLAPQKGHAAASLVTAPLPPGGSGKIRLNVEGATADLPLRVELLDARHQPLTGYGGDAAARVTASGTGVEVNWPEARRAGLPAGGPLAVKVTFPGGSAARVYALYVGE
jgi:hypothetical protein